MKNATDVSIVDDLIEIDSQKGNQNLTDDQDLLIQANVILKFIVGISKKENPEDDLLNTSPDSLSLLSDGFEESFIRDLGDNLIIFLLDNKVNLRTESKEKKEWEYMFMAALVCFRACRYPTGLMQLSRLAQGGRHRASHENSDLLRSLKLLKISKLPQKTCGSFLFLRFLRFLRNFATFLAFLIHYCIP
jgi:hypothetical protein